MLLYPRGVMSADFDKMSVWDVGYARQLHRTPIYLGFHVGMGTYGGYWTETPYVYRGQWIDADLLLNDNVRTVFSTARLDFRRNAQLVPYTQLRFGYYSMFTTYSILGYWEGELEADFLESGMIHSDSTWMYGGNVGIRFQSRGDSSYNRGRFTLDIYGGFMKGSKIRYAAQNGARSASEAMAMMQAAGVDPSSREAEWVENAHHGMLIYRSPLDTIEFGLRLGVRF